MAADITRIVKRNKEKRKKKEKLREKLKICKVLLAGAYGVFSRKKIFCIFSRRSAARKSAWNASRKDGFENYTTTNPDLCLVNYCYVSVCTFWWRCLPSPLSFSEVSPSQWFSIFWWSKKKKEMQWSPCNRVVVVWKRKERKTERTKIERILCVKMQSRAVNGDKNER